MNRPGRIVFALAAVVAISALNFQPIEAQTSIRWEGQTFRAGHPDTAVGTLLLEGTLEGFPQQQFHVSDVHLDQATLKCNKSKEEIQVTYGSAAVNVSVEKSELIVQVIGDDGSAYVVSGSINKNDFSLEAKVEVFKSRIWFNGPSDRVPGDERCTARLKFESPLIIID